MKDILALFGIVTLIAIPSLAFSADNSGTWKHAQNPTWIEIRLEEGGGTVEWVRVDKIPVRWKCSVNQVKLL